MMSFESGLLFCIESTTSGSTAGVGTAITGVANRVANSNGALVYGAAALAALHPLDFDPDAK